MQPHRFSSFKSPIWPPQQNFSVNSFATPQSVFDSNVVPFPITGYSVNFTAIPTIAGDPIPTLVLKRKRKRRRRRIVQNWGLAEKNNSHYQDPNYIHDFATPIAFRRSNSRFPTSWRSTGNLSCSTGMSVARFVPSNGNVEVSGAGGSCPDLANQFDDILLKAMQNEREILEHKADVLVKSRRRTANSMAPESEEQSKTPMRTSIYEICAPVELETVESCDLNGNLQTSTRVIPLEQQDDRSLGSSNDSDSPPDSTTATQRLADKLRRELEDLQFRHTHEWQRADGSVMNIKANPLFKTEYYSQQDDCSPSHLTTFDPKHRSFTTSSLINGREEMKHDYRSFDADYFEGMNIRVNPFEEDNDMILAEADCPPPSRFQQLQWAIQRQKERYNEQIQNPQRVCCLIM